MPWVFQMRWEGWVRNTAKLPHVKHSWKVITGSCTLPLDVAVRRSAVTSPIKTDSQNQRWHADFDVGWAICMHSSNLPLSPWGCFTHLPLHPSIRASSLGVSGEPEVSLEKPVPKTA